jgi:hypothetical protein
MKYIHKLLLSILTISFISLSFSFAQGTQSFVYLKDSAGLLKGAIMYQPSIVNTIKINSFCAFKKISEGLTCEYLSDNSPLASDPQKAIKLVTQTPNLSFNAIQKLQDDLANATKKLNNIFRSTQTTTAPANNYSVNDAAVPDKLSGTDTNRVTTSEGENPNNTQTGNTSTMYGTAYSAPQYNAPNFTALISGEIARQLALQPQVVQVVQQSTPLTPSQVVQSFFNGTPVGSQYVGYGANNDPNSNAKFKDLDLGGSVTAPNGDFGNLTATVMAIASSTVGSLTATTALMVSSTITNATTTSLYSNVANISNASITNSNIGVLNVTNNYALNTSSTYATITNLFGNTATYTDIYVNNLYASHTYSATTTVSSLGVFNSFYASSTFGDYATYTEATTTFSYSATSSVGGLFAQVENILTS